MKARSVADKFSADVAGKRGLSQSEMAAVEAIHRAVEFNPHVPKYLLGMEQLILIYNILYNLIQKSTPNKKCYAMFQY